MRKYAYSMKICLKLGVRLITEYFRATTALFNNKAFLDIHDVLKGLLGLMGRSPRVGSLSSFDCFEG